MKLKIISFAAALLMAAPAVCGCSMFKDDEKEENTFETDNALDEIFADVPDAESGPLLKIQDTEAEPGGIAEVTVSVSNAKDKWCLCGFHIVYDDELDCINVREGEPDAKYTAGPASSEAPLRVAMEWFGTKPNEKLDRDLDAIFYTAAFADDYGGDGDIATFYIQIPEDAESGDEYDVDFYYYSTDTFKGMDGDRSFEKYAFSNWEGGKITVK